MEAPDSCNPTSNGDYTTDAVDQAEAARLKEYLANDAGRKKQDTIRHSKDSSISFVSIDEGRHKYVLIQATYSNGEDQQQQQQQDSHLFVVSHRGAHYHRNVAEWYIPKLQNQGFSNIEIQGGGILEMISISSSRSLDIVMDSVRRIMKSQRE
jgi:hypothetical protein